MASYKTEVIVLKRIHFGEADRILTLLTKEFGKIKVLAKGIRKTSSRKAGHLELLNRAKLVLAEGRNFDIITEAETLENFSNLREKLHLTAAGYFLAETGDALLHESEKNEKIFDLFWETLRHLNQVERDSVLAYFSLKMLDILGYRPELYRCAICHRPLTKEENFLFSFDEGGVVGECHKNFRLNNFQKLSLKGLILAREIARRDWQNLKRIKPEIETEREVEEWAKNLVEYQIQKNLKSKKFLKDVELAGN